MPTPTTETPPDQAARWKFIREVLVFQLKLVLGNLQNFVLVPISLGAAAFDLFLKREREDSLFYKVLELGRLTDEGINVYGAIGGYHATGPSPGSASGDARSMKEEFSVDSVLARVDEVIAREYEKGGTTASLKAAVDRAIDGIQATGEKSRDKIDDAIQRASQKFRPKTE